jgi:hypothetical protein
VNTLYCLEEWRDEQRISPPGDNFTTRGKSSLLGDNYAPGGQSLPLVLKLRMVFRLFNREKLAPNSKSCQAFES